jgi:magnesium chelatase family protein
VLKARSAQLARQGRANALISGSEAEQAARLGPEGRHTLRDAVVRMRLSARAHHRVLRVARTIADLEGAPEVGRAHVCEALGYRGAPGSLTA